MLPRRLLLWELGISPFPCEGLRRCISLFQAIMEGHCEGHQIMSWQQALRLLHVRLAIFLSWEFYQPGFQSPWWEDLLQCPFHFLRYPNPCCHQLQCRCWSQCLLSQESCISQYLAGSWQHSFCSDQFERYANLAMTNLGKMSFPLWKNWRKYASMILTGKTYSEKCIPTRHHVCVVWRLTTIIMTGQSHHLDSLARSWLLQHTNRQEQSTVAVTWRTKWTSALSSSRLNLRCQHLVIILCSTWVSRTKKMRGIHLLQRRCVAFSPNTCIESMTLRWRSCTVFIHNEEGARQSFATEHLCGNNEQYG